LREGGRRHEDIPPRPKPENQIFSSEKVTNNGSITDGVDGMGGVEVRLFVFIHGKSTR
jgi:hypothetical protein